MEVRGEGHSSRSSRDTLEVAHNQQQKINALLSQCTPSIPLQELISAIQEIVSNNGSPSEFLPRLHPLFDGKVKTIYHSSYVSCRPVLSAVSEIIQYILEEVLPGYWDPNLKVKDIRRIGNGAFVEKSVEDGTAWTTLLQVMLASIFTHLEQSVEQTADGRDVKNQENRTIVAEQMHQVLALILLGPNSWRLPLELSYYAFDIISNLISAHPSNKRLFHPVLKAAKLSDIVHQGYDRALSERALETAYRIMPLQDNKGEKLAWIQDLFPQASSSSFNLFREKFEVLKAAVYYDVAKEVLNTLARSLIYRAQPFTSSILLFNSISFKVQEVQTLIDWWIGRDIIVANVEHCEEEKRFWFGLESVEAVILDVEPDEIKVTITLNSPARLNYSYTKDTANQNIVVFRTPAGDTLRVIKKTLIDRARSYPKVNPRINGSLPSSSAGIKSASNSHRRSSQAVPITSNTRALPTSSKDSFIVPNSDDVFPSHEQPKFRLSHENNHSGESGEESSLTTRQRGIILADIAEVGDGYNSKSSSKVNSENGSKNSNQERETQKILMNVINEVIVEERQEEMSNSFERNEGGRQEEKGGVNTKTPGTSRNQDPKKTPVEILSTSRPLDAPRKVSGSHLEEGKETITPSQRSQALRGEEGKKESEVDESDLSELEEDEDAREESAPNPVIIEPSVSAKNQTKSKSKALVPQPQPQEKASKKEESIEQARPDPKIVKGKAVAKSTTRIKRKVEIETPSDQGSARQTRSRAAGNITTQESNSIVPVTKGRSNARKVPRQVKKATVTEEVQVEAPSTPVPAKKRRRLEDPSPVDETAPTATTLVVTDKSTRANTLEHKKDLVSPIRTYGKEKKERKMATPVQKKDAKRKKNKVQVSEEVEEEEVVREEKEEEEAVASLEIDEILHGTAKGPVSHLKKSSALDLTTNRDTSGKNRKSDSNHSAPSERPSRSTGVAKSSKKVEVVPEARSKKKIASFSQLVAEPLPLLLATQNRKLDARQVSEDPPSNAEEGGADVREIRIDTSDQSLGGDEYEPIVQDESVSAFMKEAADLADKVVSRDLEKQKSKECRRKLASEEDDRTEKEDDNERQTVKASKVVEEEVLQSRPQQVQSNQVPLGLAVDRLTDAVEQSRSKENVTAPLLNLLIIEAVEKPISKSTSRGSVSPLPLPPPQDTLPRVVAIAPIAPKKSFFKSKPAAPTISRRNESLTSRVSNASSNVHPPRPPGGGKSKSKQALPKTNPGSSNKGKGKDVEMADDEMEVDEESSEDIANPDDELQSHLLDMVDIILAQSRDRSRNQAVSFQQSVAKINKKATRYISDFHRQTGEFVDASKAQLAQQQVGVEEAKTTLEKLRISREARLALLGLEQ